MFSSKRNLCTVRRTLCSVHEEKVYSIRRRHFQQEDSLCGWKRKSAVLRMSHLKYAEKKYALPGGLHLQYEVKVMEYW